MEQSVTSRSRNRKYLVPKKSRNRYRKKIGTEKSLGTGLEIIWYRKKSRNRSRKNLVPKKNIGTSLEIFQNICVDLGPGLVPFPGFLHFFVWYRNRSRKNLVPKKVSEPVSKKMSTEKSLGIGLDKFWYRKKSRNRSRKILVPKKSLGIGIVQILGLITHCPPFPASNTVNKIYKKTDVF